MRLLPVNALKAHAQVRKYARKAADYVVVVTPEVSEDVRQVLLQVRPHALELSGS